MADGTHIEWTDATWNVVNGCSVLSPGCTNCYAMRLAGTRLKNHASRAGLTIDTKAGPVWTGETRFNEPVLLDPLKWRRPRRIFVCAHGDLFHESVPDEWIDRVFSVMSSAKHHQFQVLTKRAKRMRDYVQSFKVSPLEFLTRGGLEPTSYGGPITEGIMPNERWPLPNVWLGVSVEDQARANDRIPYLLATPAAVRWLSCEPLLGPVDLTRLRPPGCTWLDGLTGNMHAGPSVFQEYDRAIDWVVAGGESGPGARAMHPDWARSLRDQCEAAGVPFLFKQWGAWWPLDHAAAEWGMPVDEARDYFLTKTTGTHALIGKGKAGRTLDGQLHAGFPA